MPFDCLNLFLNNFCEPVSISDPIKGFSVSTSKTFYQNQALIYKIKNNSFPILLDNLPIPVSEIFNEEVYVIIDPTNVLIKFPDTDTAIELINDGTLTYESLIDVFKNKIGASIWDAFQTTQVSLNDSLLGMYNLTTSLDDLSGHANGVSLSELRTTPLSTDGAYFAGNDKGILRLPWRDDFSTYSWTIAVTARWQTRGAKSYEEQNIVKRWNYDGEEDFLPKNEQGESIEELGVVFDLYKGRGNALQVNLVKEDPASWSERVTLITAKGVIEENRDYLFILQVTENKLLELIWFVDANPSPFRQTVSFQNPDTTGTPFRPNIRKIGFTLGVQEYSLTGTTPSREYLNGWEQYFWYWGRALTPNEWLRVHNDGRYWLGS